MTAPRTAKKAAATKPKKNTLRDQLAKKRAKVVTLYFPVDDEGEKAIETLTKREQLLELAETQHARQGEKSEIDLDSIRRLVADATAKRDAHTMMLQIRGLSEDAYDALASEFYVEDPPEDATEEQRKALDEEADHKGREWTYHALAQTVVNSDLTADDWREELTSDRWTFGDIAKLRLAIRQALGAQPADGIPKD